MKLWKRVFRNGVSRMKLYKIVGFQTKPPSALTNARKFFISFQLRWHCNTSEMHWWTCRGMSFNHTNAKSWTWGWGVTPAPSKKWMVMFWFNWVWERHRGGPSMQCNEASQRGMSRASHYKVLKTSYFFGKFFWKCSKKIVFFWVPWLQFNLRQTILTLPIILSFMKLFLA